VWVAVLAACGTADGSGGGGDLPAYQQSPASPTTAAPTTSPPEAEGEDIDGAGSGSGSTGWTWTLTPEDDDAPQPKADPYLKKVSLRTADVKHLGLVAKPAEDATSLEWPTVAACTNGTYPSEKKRKARYQVALTPRVPITSDGTKFVFDDPELEASVTRYDSAASAEQAMAEWRDAVSRVENCVDIELITAFVPGLSLGDPVEKRDDALPIVDNSALTVRISLKGEGEVARGFTFLQRHGNLIADVSYPGGSSHTYAEVRELATVLGNRVLETRT
jgi:hypothetical protein